MIARHRSSMKLPEMTSALSHSPLSLENTSGCCEHKEEPQVLLPFSIPAHSPILST